MNNFCSENLFLLPTTPFQVFSEFVLWLFDFPFNPPSLSFYPFHIFVMYKRHGHANLTLEHFLKIAFAVKLLGYMDKSRGFPGSLVRDGTRFSTFLSYEQIFHHHPHQTPAAQLPSPSPSLSSSTPPLKRYFNEYSWKYLEVSDKYSSTLPQTPFARPLPESRAGSPGKLTNNQKMASNLKLIRLGVW